MASIEEILKNPEIGLGPTRDLDDPFGIIKRAQDMAKILEVQGSILIHYDDINSDIQAYLCGLLDAKNLQDNRLDIESGLKQRLKEIASQYDSYGDINILPVVLSVTKNYVDRWQMYYELFGSGENE